MRTAILILLMAAATGCDARDTRAPETGKSSATPAAAPVQVDYKPGQNVIVLKDGAKCIDASDNADPEPWEMVKGAFVSFVRADGTELIVETAPGMPCRIAADAVGSV